MTASHRGGDVQTGLFHGAEKLARAFGAGGPCLQKPRGNEEAQRILRRSVRASGTWVPKRRFSGWLCPQPSPHPHCGAGASGGRAAVLGRPSPSACLTGSTRLPSGGLLGEKGRSDLPVRGDLGSRCLHEHARRLERCSSQTGAVGRGEHGPIGRKVRGGCL